MGSKSSKPEEPFPAVTEDEIAALRDGGKLLCVATPKSDIVEGNHNLATIFYAEYENGTELTLLFTEDTQNDSILFTALRKPILGQKCDLVTIFLLSDGTVEFPNTHSGDQTWETKRPKSHQKTVDVGKFEKRAENLLLMWVNTANHLLSEQNNNEPKEEGEEYQAFFCLPVMNNNPNATEYVVRRGSRDEVDKHFKGIVRSVAKLMTPARKKQLGKRIS